MYLPKIDFGLNSLEGGQSLAFGGEYKLKDKQNNTILTAGLASVLKETKMKKSF